MNWIEICTSQTQGTCPSSFLFQTMCADRARSVHCNLYILLALKISLHILVKVKKLTTNVLKSECLGHLIQIKIVSFLSYFVIFRKKIFITSILKSLLILAIWLALSTIICFRITLSFAQSEFCQAMSIWQNMTWTAPRKHPTIIHWHIWSLNFISRTFSDGMWVGFHNRKYDQSEKSKICPKDHLWLSLSWNKKIFAVTVRWKTSKVTYRFHNHCHNNPGSKYIYGFCLWMKSVNISHGWNKFVRYKDS